MILISAFSKRHQK